MSKHTPGPWHAGAVDRKTVWGTRADGTHGPLLARTANVYEFGALSDDQECANALLMAAAPDLLAACRQAHASIYALIDRVPSDDRRIVIDILAELAAAILKATGEASS